MILHDEIKLGNLKTTQNKTPKEAIKYIKIRINEFHEHQNFNISTSHPISQKKMSYSPILIHYAIFLTSFYL